MTRLPTVPGFFLVVLFGVLFTLFSTHKQAYADVITDFDAPHTVISASSASGTCTISGSNAGGGVDNTISCDGASSVTITFDCQESDCASVYADVGTVKGTPTTSRGDGGTIRVNYNDANKVISYYSTDAVGNAETTNSTTISFRLYSISGNIYMDTDDTGTYSAGTDTAFGESVTVHTSGGIADVVTSTGAYTVNNLPSGSYTISIDTPTGYKSTVSLSTQPVTVNSATGNISNINFLVRGWTIQGSLFIDYDHNGTQETYDPDWDSSYAAATITLSGGYTSKSPTTTDSNGEFIFKGLKGGTTVPTAGYTVTVTNTSSYTTNYTGSQYPSGAHSGIYLGPPMDDPGTANFSVTPLYTIAGNVYVDTDKDEYKDHGEGNYTSGTSTIKITTTTDSDCSSPSQTLATGDGTYTATGLVSGNYKVCYTSLPTSQGYELKYPVPAFFLVTVGRDTTPDEPYECSISSYHDAACAALGSITGLDFGISNSNPTIQLCGTSWRSDGGITDKIPSTSVCGTTALVNCPSGSAAGVAITGGTSANWGSEGGTASSQGWVAGGTTYTETFSPVNAGVIRTSYDYYITSARQSGITITDLAPSCGSGGIASCDLSSSLANGVYKADGNLTLTSGSGTYTFPSSKNFVILVNGNLTIQENIHVPTTSTATFSVAGSIYVDTTVGTTSRYCAGPGGTGTPIDPVTQCNIQGFFSADNNVVVQGVNSCTSGTTEKQICFAGSVVANAAGKTGGSAGTFTLNRDLCADDRQYPTLIIQQRPDMIINSPSFIQAPTYIFQEVAP